MKNWFVMNLIAPKSAEIDILAEIGDWGVTAKDFAESLRELGDVEQIRLNINSPGGDVFAGMAIYNLLKQHAAVITVKILGMAASAASFIACAGDKVLMPANAYIMTHDVRGGCYGTSDELKVTSELVAKLTDSIAAIYAAKTGKDKKECLKMMRGDHWMTAAEAFEVGFCDEVLEEQRLVACAQFSNKFSSLPVGLASANAEEGEVEVAPSVFQGSEDASLSEVPVGSEVEPVPLVNTLGVVGVNPADLALLNARLAQLTLERDEALASVQAVAAQVDAQVLDQMAGLGVSADQLPSAVDAAVAVKLTMAEYLEGLAKLDDPKARSEYHNKNFDRINKQK